MRNRGDPDAERQYPEKPNERGTHAAYDAESHPRIAGSTESPQSFLGTVILWLIALSNPKNWSIVSVVAAIGAAFRWHDNGVVLP